MVEYTIKELEEFILDMDEHVNQRIIFELNRLNGQIDIFTRYIDSLTILRWTDKRNDYMRREMDTLKRIALVVRKALASGIKIKDIREHTYELLIVTLDGEEWVDVDYVRALI